MVTGSKCRVWSLAGVALLAGCTEFDPRYNPQTAAMADGTTSGQADLDGDSTATTTSVPTGTSGTMTVTESTGDGGTVTDTASDSDASGDSEDPPPPVRECPDPVRLLSTSATILDIAPSPNPVDGVWVLAAQGDEKVLMRFGQDGRAIGGDQVVFRGPEIENPSITAIGSDVHMVFESSTITPGRRAVFVVPTGAGLISLDLVRPLSQEQDAHHPKANYDGERLISAYGAGASGILFTISQVNGQVITQRNLAQGLDGSALLVQELLARPEGVSALFDAPSRKLVTMALGSSGFIDAAIADVNTTESTLVRSPAGSFIVTYTTESTLLRAAPLIDVDPANPQLGLEEPFDSTALKPITELVAGCTDLSAAAGPQPTTLIATMLCPAEDGLRHLVAVEFVANTMVANPLVESDDGVLGPRDFVNQRAVHFAETSWVVWSERGEDAGIHVAPTCLESQRRAPVAN